MKKIHNSLKDLRDFIVDTESSMENLLNYTKDLDHYKKFNETLSTNRQKLHELREKIELISPYKFSLIKIKELGRVLKCFYELHSNNDINECILYSLGFTGYIEVLEGLIQNVKKNHIHLASLENPIVEEEETAETKENKGTRIYV
jgi:hypothetical protein